MERRRFLAVLALAGALPASAAGTPKDWVAAVYKGAGGASAWDALVAKAMGRKRPFSKAFDTALQAADARSRKIKEPWLDFDPVSNSQDPAIHGLRIDIVSESPTAVTISAQFRRAPDAKSTASQVIYDFVRENNLWALDDIRGSHQNGKGANWSLRQLARDGAARR